MQYKKQLKNKKKQRGSGIVKEVENDERYINIQKMARKKNVC